MGAEPKPKFLTTKEVAQALRYSIPAINLKIRQGKIPAVRLGQGRRNLIPRSYVDSLRVAAEEGEIMKCKNCGKEL